MFHGRLFHSCGRATRKARLAIVESFKGVATRRLEQQSAEPVDQVIQQHKHQVQDTPVRSHAER